jgi:trehalose 6-phosphate phosphatase
MNDLSACWTTIEKKLTKSFCFLFLDYDGTLAPIVGSPEKAQIPVSTRQLLSKLASLKNCRVAIISGRSLKDIRNRIGFDNVICAGNHGLEMDGPDLRFNGPIPSQWAQFLGKIYGIMINSLSKINGVLIEYKGLTMSIHYRLVTRNKLPLVRKVFTRLISPYHVLNLVRIVSGKKVIEVKPPAKWGKGECVLWLLMRYQSLHARKKVLPIYVGDDKTDEDAFKALKNKGITIFVGKPGKSNAKFYLKNTEEVIELLHRVAVCLSAEYR